VGAYGHLKEDPGWLKKGKLREQVSIANMWGFEWVRKVLIVFAPGPLGTLGASRPLNGREGRRYGRRYGGAMGRYGLVRGP